MAMTAEMKAEILAFLEQREQEKKRNRTTYQRVYEPYRERMDAFDYEHIYHYSTGGQTTVSCKYRYPIQNAMGTLLRAVYGVDAVAKLPAEQEEEMREVFDKILSVMETYKRRETE